MELKKNEAISEPIEVRMVQYGKASTVLLSSVRIDSCYRIDDG